MLSLGFWSHPGKPTRTFYDALMTVATDASTPMVRHLRAARWRLGMSQREVARRGDLSHTYVQRLERGEYRDMHPATMRRVARAYGTSYRQLLELAGVLDG